MSLESKTRLAAYGLLVEEQRILLCRISLMVANAAGKWTLPGGGIEFGEHPEDALRREFLEETGLRIQPIGIRAVDSEFFEDDIQSVHVIRLLYGVKIQSGELCDERDGSTDCARWFTRAEIEDLPLVPVARLGVRLALGTT